MDFSLSPVSDETGRVVEALVGDDLEDLVVDRGAGERFVDETISGPMARFNHSHTFTPGRRGTWIEDRIDFHVVMLFDEGPVRHMIDFTEYEAIFKPAYPNDLDRKDLWGMLRAIAEGQPAPG